MFPKYTIELLAMGLIAYGSWPGLHVIPGVDAREANIIYENGKLKDPITQLEDKAPPLDIQEAKGMLTAVDPGKGLLTLQITQGLMLFSLNSNTRIMLGNVEGTMADLRPGMRLRVIYLNQANQKVAQSILVQKGLVAPDIVKAWK